MNHDEMLERLDSIVAQFYPPPNRGLLGVAVPPFDISRPVIHDSKKDFLREKETIEKALKAAEVLRRMVMDQVSDDDPKQKEMSSRLCLALDQHARGEAFGNVATTIAEFLGDAAAKHGLCLVSYVLVSQLTLGLLNRKHELIGQEAEFWSDPHRAPNHYARIIALRFALAIHDHSGSLPTFGMARDGNHPSTDFGRALEEIFEVLGISANVKNAAIWALAQAKVQEEERPKNTRIGGLLGLGPQSGHPSNALAALADQAAKKGQ